MQNYFLVAVLTTGLIKLAVPQSIDPSTVPDATKQKWCTDQIASCPLLCLQIPGASAGTTSNTCDSTTLSYTCVCSNGQSPNISQYSQTVPYYECTQAATNCVNNCAQGDTSCQSACRNDHPCGAQDPVRVNTSTISTMASTTSFGAGSKPTGSNTFTGFGGAGATSTSSGTSGAEGRAQAMALGFGRTYGLVMVLAGLCGGFTLML